MVSPGLHFGVIAQPGRAPVRQTGYREFKSRWLHQIWVFRLSRLCERAGGGLIRGTDPSSKIAKSDRLLRARSSVG